MSHTGFCLQINCIFSGFRIAPFSTFSTTVCLVIFQDIKWAMIPLSLTEITWLVGALPFTKPRKVYTVAHFSLCKQLSILYYMIKKALLVEKNYMAESLACILPEGTCLETQIFLEIYWGSSFKTATDCDITYRQKIASKSAFKKLTIFFSYALISFLTSALGNWTN